MLTPEIVEHQRACCCPSCGKSLLAVVSPVAEEWPWDEAHPPKLLHYPCPECGVRLEEVWGESLQLDRRPEERDAGQAAAH
jgi:predicted RNA-binding Zn-ribbon protein involved in translation (DUF1610 family)